MRDKIERKVKTVNPTRKVKLREGNKADRKNSFFFHDWTDFTNDGCCDKVNSKSGR